MGDSFTEYLRMMGDAPVWPDHWALSELDRVVGNEALASSPERKDSGEWDVLRRMPARDLRRLRGARYMRRGANQPDQLAEWIIPRVSAVDSVDQATEWFVRTALVAIEERRRERHYERHLRVARDTGYANYYERRVALAQWDGHASVWEMRKARGWT